MSCALVCLALRGREGEFLSAEVGVVDCSHKMRAEVLIQSKQRGASTLINNL